MIKESIMPQNNQTNTLGRPSKLEQTLERAKAYLEGGYLENEEVIPTLAGLALYAHISRSTLYEYKKISGEFSDTLEAILALQETKLINKGLLGEFNPTLAKLMLANHGYSDRVKQELAGEIENKIPPALNIIIGECIHDLSDNELDLQEKLALLREERLNQQYQPPVLTITKTP